MLNKIIRTYYIKKIINKRYWLNHQVGSEYFLINIFSDINSIHFFH